MPDDFFSSRPEVRPTIYAYSIPGNYLGYLKVGFTDRDVETRINEQLHTSGLSHRTELVFSAMRSDGSCFLDHDVHDFDLLCSLNVFNGETMNQAIWQFKRYEDSSLGYTGINRHENEDSVGGWDTVIRKEEFDAMFAAQQKSMASAISERQTFVNQPVAPKPVTAAPVRQSVSTQPKAAQTGATIRPAPQPIVPHNKPTTCSGFGAVPTVKPAAQPVQKADVSGIGPGTVVVHKSPTIGEGVVTKIDAAKKYIHIKFKSGEKTFTFPDSFDKGFLSKK